MCISFMSKIVYCSHSGQDATLAVQTIDLLEKPLAAFHGHSAYSPTPFTKKAASRPNTAFHTYAPLELCVR